jgi:hypothetical protein
MHEIRKYLMLKLLFAGMSFTEVIQLKVQGKKLHCGSLKRLLAGRAASTPGSTSKCLIELFDARHPPRSEYCYDYYLI